MTTQIWTKWRLCLLNCFLVACHGKVIESETIQQASVRNFVPSFIKDSTIHEVHGVRIDTQAMLYVDYYVYTAPRQKVLAGVEAIKPDTKLSYYTSDACHVVESSGPLRIAPEEKNERNSFFWRYEKLKSSKVYKCLKPPFMHYLIFDIKSDTVYHRITELRD